MYKEKITSKWEILLNAIKVKNKLKLYLFILKAFTKRVIESNR